MKMIGRRHGGVGYDIEDWILETEQDVADMDANVNGWWIEARKFRVGDQISRRVELEFVPLKG